MAGIKAEAQDERQKETEEIRQNSIHAVMATKHRRVDAAVQADSRKKGEGSDLELSDRV